MKDLKEQLNKSVVNEAATAWKVNFTGSTVTKGLDLMNINIRPNKEYGFMVYDEDVELVHLIAADSAQDFADGLCIDLEEAPDVEDMFKLKVGQMTKDFMSNGIAVRIW